MRNQLTCVFINVLAHTGSSLAESIREKELITWLAECNDQSARGRGLVGFFISELPWTHSGFEEEKRFLLKVIKTAQTKKVWELLGYELRTVEIIFDCLQRFYHLVSSFEARYIDSASYDEWKEEGLYDPPWDFQKCSRHNVILTIYGCIICNYDGFHAFEVPPLLAARLNALE